MSKIPPVKIQGRLVGHGHRPLVVAEMSGNHNGDIDRALKLMIEAKKAGVDAVKLQTYTPDTITINHDGPEFILDKGLWEGRILYELYEEAHTPWAWHKKLFKMGKELDLIVFSAPFDHTAVDFLEELNCPAYKIASPEIIDIPLIKKVASTKKPIIISTGMATFEEISEAVSAASEGNPSNVIVLHCTSSYPSEIHDANLTTIREIQEKLKVHTGLSDHTKGILTSVLSVGMGACLIEKHFTLKRSDGGVDSAFSLEASELKELVREVHAAASALGSPSFAPLDAESTVFKNRRSLYVTADIETGDPFTTKNVRSIRPGYGLRPKFLPFVLGRLSTRSIKFGEPLEESMIVGGLSDDV